MRRLLATIICVILFASPVQAAEDGALDFAGATLTGDWGGARQAAWRSGLSLEAALKLDVLRNRGGQGEGTRTMTNLDLRFRADLNKVAGWEGTTAYLHVLDDRGAGINARQSGSLMGVSNIEVPVPTARVFHAWLQRNFLDDRVSLLAGLYPIDAEFFVMDSASIFLHPAYGPPADLALTRGPSVFNNAAFGLRLKWLSADRTHYAQGALLDGIPNDPARPKRTAIRFAKGDGAFAIAEFGWTPAERGHVFEVTEAARILPTPALVAHEKYEGNSKYALGVWRYGNRVADQFDVDANGDPLQRRSWGGYVLAERTLMSLGGQAGRDLTAFARYSISDGHATAIDRMWNLGVRLRGPLAGRPDDMLGIGWTRGRLAPGFRAAQAATGVGTATAEDALEITWRAAITKWLALQPNLQAIRHPGGASASSRARVVGIRMELAL